MSELMRSENVVLKINRVDGVKTGWNDNRLSGRPAIALAHALLWLTHCFGLRIALAYALLWLTHCFGLRIALAYALLWLTHCFGLRIALAYALLWLTHCFGLRIALAYALLWLTHCFGLQCPGSSHRATQQFVCSRMVDEKFLVRVPLQAGTHFNGNLP